MKRITKKTLNAKVTKVKSPIGTSRSKSRIKERLSRANAVDPVWIQFQEQLSGVDEDLFELIDDLNEAGFETSSCCQGKCCKADFVNDKHCKHAFITFAKIPKKYRRKAEELGLSIYNGGISIAPIYDADDDETFMLRNLEFPERVRELFLPQPKE